MEQRQIAMENKPLGINRNLASYGDTEFSKYIRRAFLASAGFDETDLDRPVVGIANTASDYNTCHRQMPELIEAAKRGVLEAGGLPFVFPTISLHEILFSPTTMIYRNLLAMKANGVTAEMSKNAVKKALETSGDSNQPVRNTLVAEGEPPKPPGKPSLSHRPPEGVDSLPGLDAVGALLKSEDPDGIPEVAASLEALTVHPGDPLATLELEEGEPGSNVKGEPIPPTTTDKASMDDSLKPGKGVDVAENGVDYHAQIYGYAGLLAGQVSVLTPIRISPDGSEASLLNLAQVADLPPPGPDELIAALSAAGVTVGVDDKAVEAACSGLAKGDLKDPLIPLARGISPVPPKDAGVEFMFDFEEQIGRILPDGSIDFRERNLFPTVTEGALLAEGTAPEPGTPGQTVKGEEVEVPTPVGIEFVAGENVRLEETGQIQKVYSEIEGGASVQVTEVTSQAGSLKRYNISVRPVAQISGDVDYETGNVDFKGNVEIKGSIDSGFSVVATGDVVVSGSVEPGAKVDAGGNFTVKQGIVGEETLIKSTTTVTAKFVQDATIEAGADVVVGSYIHNAHIRAGGQVKMEGKGGSGGSIVGGATWATGGIISRSVGSVRSTTTSLTIGLDPDVAKKLGALSEAVRRASVLLQKLLTALGLSTLETEEVKKLIAANPQRQKQIMEYVQKANELAKVEEKRLQEQEELRVQVTEGAKKATLDVKEVAFARTRLRIGDAETALHEDLKGVRFEMNPEGIIVPKDLSGSSDKDSAREGAEE